VEDPELAADALEGLRAYERNSRPSSPQPKPEIARVGGASLRDHGGSGRPALLIPSLINPPRILDLDEQVSLTKAIAGMSRHALLLDWGKADERAGFSIGEHVENLLLPLLSEIGEPPALIGYCLGGTMAIAAANLAQVERVVTIAAPWHFGNYPFSSRSALAAMWSSARTPAEQLGALPMEVLQAAFWSLDPEKTVRKFAEFGKLDPSSPDAQRFIQLEDWANAGEPLPYPAAKELIEDFFGRDSPGSGLWRVGTRSMTDSLATPSLQLTSEHDRIAPAATAPSGKEIGIPAGHVGMVVGSVRMRLHDALSSFLGPACRPTG
jgi:polyhydroxyalkanoate synthase subunit PhaC